MAASTFTLAPRGMGPTSFRMYEALSMASLPIYIWNDVRWVPQEKELDWERFAVIVHQSEIDHIPKLVEHIETRGVSEARAYLASIYEDYFTYAGTCRWISESASRLRLDAVLALTAHRRMV